MLGDAVDRGPEPIRVLRDMMMRPNVTLILGNHEYIMYKVLSKLAVEITDENSENYLTADDLMDFTYWMQDGVPLPGNRRSGICRRGKRIQHGLMIRM